MIIAPSLLAANYARFRDEARRVQRARADWLHVDIMDGHFVPNLTFGPGIVAMLKRCTRLPLDVHLMCSRPETLLQPFREAGAWGLTVHVELDGKVPSLLWKIRSLGARVGLAVNPPTPISAVKPFLKLVDLVLVMTVNPGFGGQSFIEETVPKIQQVARWRRESGHDFRIQVDGGINYQTVRECAAAGADAIVSGTTLFRSRNLKAAVAKMRRIAEEAAAGAVATSRPAAEAAPDGALSAAG
ncbi:MAG: ribulose-phosphate 3-epimerase [Verrucomicrobia bacterium]|nr:MAG: ribulose-phosphate 3-epimerase [Verrucomicrobiota bacterium]